MTEKDNQPMVRQTYKDRIFRMIFKEKKEFLVLYNAMNNTAYTNPDDLTVTTLDNAIYMNMRNDVSFLLHDRLTLCEHQSTDNPNMPLEQAIEAAINKCIAVGVLADFLRENRAEVLKMGLYEYDEELHMRLEREEAREEGERIGEKRGEQRGEQKGKLSQLVSLVKRKYLRDKPLSRIADELDEDIDNIRGIYELIAQNPARDEEWIVSELLNR